MIELENQCKDGVTNSIGVNESVSLVTICNRTFRVGQQMIILNVDQ